MDSGVYQLDYQSQGYEVVAKAEILLGYIVEEDAYFLDTEGTIHRWEGDSDKLQTVVADCLGDYCWGSTNGSLLCASLESPSTLRIINELGLRSITIKGQALITSLTGISPPKGRNYIGEYELIVVGYSDGLIHLHSQKGELINTFSLLEHNNVTMVQVRP
jgi:hypothetical protein